MTTENMKMITEVLDEEHDRKRVFGVRVLLSCGHATTTTYPEVGGFLVCMECDALVQQGRFGVWGRKKQHYVAR